MLSNLWFGRRFLKVYILIAMAARILHRTQLFEFEREPPKEHSCEIQSIVSEKFFEGRVYRRTHRQTD